MAQFYKDDRVMMITGREGRRELRVDKQKLFGVRGKGKINPPPYTVQIEVSSRDPQRIANQNQMFMEAYTMSAQAQQFFPLSSLFNILNLDGKDKILPVIRENEHYQEQMQALQILPVIRENEHYQEQMQALQQQVEQMGQQMEQMQNENQNLRKAVSQTTNALAQMGARRGGGAVVNQTGGPMKMAEAGGGQNTSNAVVEQARNTLGMPTGAELPT